MTIVCKIYLDKDENGDDVIVTECAKRNYPYNSIQNYPIKERGTIYIYPSTLIGISEEAANALRAKIDKGEWKLNAFEADFTFETDHYKTEIGLFGYLPKHNKGETLTKKIFRLKDTLMVDTMKLWDIIINKMPRGDNEFLKKLDLSGPYSW